MALNFATELKKLQQQFMEMGVNTNEQLYLASKAFIEHDAELAQQVIEMDPRLNDAEINLEKNAFKLMALQQPLANDFRLIMSILKASNDLERIGDYATHIARTTIHSVDDPHWQAVETQIQAMAEQLRQMMEQFIDAFFYTDEKAAYEVANQDLQIDIKYAELHKQLIEAMIQDQTFVRANERYLSVIRRLERTGDHIVNLAEWVIYAGEAKLVELNPGKTDKKLVQQELDQ